jgi:organic hydroperoxide reductase OsmC/OhrA
VNTDRSFRFSNSVAWNTGLRGRISAPGKPEMDIGSPPEFRGDPGVWSPEELLVAAVNACLMLTFVWFAQNKRVGVVAYESRAEGMLQSVDGRYRITEVTVEPSLVLKSQSDVDAARVIMDEAEASCFISHSITARVKIAPQFRIEAPQGAR